MNEDSSHKKSTVTNITLKAQGHSFELPFSNSLV